eukprot:XP_014783128.1 PREDICTED: trans-Golgi network integral membrane protein 2-like [Octopus bimaculoides]
MASFGQTVAGFLLFCLCCFYQPCLSSSPHCLDLPSSCINIDTFEPWHPTCIYLKDYQKFCVPQATTSDVTVCRKLPEMAPGIAEAIVPCQEFCQKFAYICKYLYVANLHQNTELTGKHLGVEASNNNTIGSSFMFSGRGVVKIPGIVSTGSGPNPVILSSDSQNPSNPRNGHNSETLSGGSINSSNTGSGATSKSISANTGDKLNSKNPSDFQNPLNRGNTPVEGAKTGIQSPGSQTPLNTGSRPNPEMLSSGSQNLSNPRIGLNSKTLSGGSINSSNAGSGATSKSISANTGDISANSRNPSDLQNPVSSRKGTGDKLNSKNPSDFQNPLNRGNAPVEGAKTGIQSPGSQTPLNTGSRPNSEMLSSDSQNLSNPRIGLNSETPSGGSVKPSNAGGISANSRNPSDFQNPVSSKKGHAEGTNADIQSPGFQNSPNNGQEAGIDASKTSDTRANISPSKDSQQKAKISIGNQIQPDTVPKKTPVSTAYNEAPSSAHFMGYFLTAIVLCIAGYIVFHNKQKVKHLFLLLMNKFINNWKQIHFHLMMIY